MKKRMFFCNNVKYHTDIKSYSFEELKENGLFNAIITVGKYRSGLGAIFPKYKLTYQNNMWEIEILSMAIS